MCQFVARCREDACRLIRFVGLFNWITERDAILSTTAQHHVGSADGTMLLISIWPMSNSLYVPRKSIGPDLRAHELAELGSFFQDGADVVLGKGDASADAELR